LGRQPGCAWIGGSGGVMLAKGEERTVPFRVDASDFRFYDISGSFVVEPGQIDVYAGNSSNATLTQPLAVTG
jgi:beta-glucosidase